MRDVVIALLVVLVAVTAFAAGCQEPGAAMREVQRRPVFWMEV